MTIDDLTMRTPRSSHRQAEAGCSAGRLVVAWQHRGSRLITPVGLLEHDEETGYRFRYLRRAARVPGFQPFLGFPLLERTYTSPRLFPIFAQRVMSPKRPDYTRYLRHLHLAEDASPWEQMARSEGRRTGDTVQVFPVPVVRTDGSTTCRFLIHGVRHVTGGDVPHLAVGDSLLLEPDPANPVNPEALLVCSATGERLGYVPDLLLPYVRAVQSNGPMELVVEHVNGPDAPVHLRILARLEGSVPEGFLPMAGPGWETFAD